MINYYRKLLNSLGEKNFGQPILVNSIPKSGTNLLKNIVLSIPGSHLGVDLPLAHETTNGSECLDYIQQQVAKFSPGKIYVGHVPYSKEVSLWFKNNNVKQLFIYRDPRDVTVSLYHYIMRDKIPRHAYYSMYLKFKNDEERLRKAITGYGEGKKKFRVSSNSIPAIDIVYKTYAPWIQKSSPDFLSLRFEDLVSDNDMHMTQIKNIVKFLNPKLIKDIALLKRISSRGMDPERSHTFRKGKINSWKEEYTQEHISAFRSVFDDSLLNEFGYDWKGENES